MLKVCAEAVHIAFEQNLFKEGKTNCTCNAIAKTAMTKAGVLKRRSEVLKKGPDFMFHAVVGYGLGPALQSSVGNVLFKIDDNLPQVLLIRCDQAARD